MILIKMQRLISGASHLCIDPQSFVLNGLNFATAKQKSVFFFFFQVSERLQVRMTAVPYSSVIITRQVEGNYS